MASVVIYKPDGNVQYQNITDVEVEDGFLRFDCRPDSMAYETTRITTTCPYFMEEKIGGR
jgi:hypothetical protein